ncbi:MAG: hypothetical protein PHO23_00510 [Candidatus Pacebacteria bacterium]|nr:hypothetical protein [Candidatus Paceibacterota bacterium]
MSAFRQFGFISLIKQIQENFINTQPTQSSQNTSFSEISSLEEISDSSDTIYCYLNSSGKYLERTFDYFYFLINDVYYKIKKENVSSFDLQNLFKNKIIITFDAKVLYQEYELNDFEFEDLKIYE